jgi:hypothetical protein
MRGPQRVPQINNSNGLRVKTSLAAALMRKGILPDCQKAVHLLAAGETQTDIARTYNGSHATIGRLQGAMQRSFEDAAVVASSSGRRTEHLHEDERCPDCGAPLILVGRAHLCRPRQAVTKPLVNEIRRSTANR